MAHVISFCIDSIAVSVFVFFLVDFLTNIESETRRLVYFCKAAYNGKYLCGQVPVIISGQSMQISDGESH